MSIVAVKKTSNGIVMGCDSQVTVGDSCRLNAGPKIRDHGNILIGSCGDVGLITRIDHEIDLPRYDGSDLLHWVAGVLLPMIRDDLDGEDGDIELIIASNAEFVVCSLKDAVKPTSDYWAIGSGAHYALGAFAVGQAAGQLVTTVATAVVVACTFDAGCGGDYHEFFLDK